MITEFTCFLDLTHINEELDEVEVECELELYQSRTNESDDPSDIEVISIKCVDESCPALLGQEIISNQAMEDRICDLYINHVSGS